MYVHVSWTQPHIQDKDEKEGDDSVNYGNSMNNGSKMGKIRDKGTISDSIKHEFALISLKDQSRAKINMLLDIVKKNIKRIVLNWFVSKMKCPICKTELDSEPIKKWMFGMWYVSRYTCLKCETQFNVYSAENGSSFTIPKN